MIRSICVLLFVLTSLPVVPAAADQGEKVSVLVEGVHCDACLGTVREKMSAFKGVELEADDIYRGEQPKYFSDPFVVRLGKTTATGLGALAQATAESQTPHADEISPRLVLVLYTEDTIDEESVSDLRMALAEVNGVLVFESGGLGGFPNKSWYWIRLDPAGGAEFKDITGAAKQAIRFQLLDPASDE